MKLSVSEQLLWNIYNFVEELDRGFDLVAPRTMKEALCPDLFRLRREYARKHDKNNFSQLVYYLKKRGYIRTKEIGRTKGVMLTPKGASKVLTLKWKIKSKQKRADGKFLMVIFDIPEKKRFLRELFRDALLFLGYQQFQKSVWVCPYDVEKESEEAIQNYNLSSFAKLFLIEKIPT